MDLTKILKKGDKIYCTLFGYVTVTKVSSTITIEDNFHKLEIYSGGQVCMNGECIIFPSKDNRDWSTWETEKKYPFKPFDKVLVRDDAGCGPDSWCCDFFSHNDDDCFVTTGGEWSQCIPYNKETEHLVGTNQDCPDKYKIW